MMAPVVGFSSKPGGSVPAVIEKVYGGVPPVATSAELYGTPTCAVPAGQASMTVGGFTVILQLISLILDLRPEESMISTVKLNVPAVVGVPVMAPVVAFSVKPGGRLPARIEKVYGGTPPVTTTAEL